MVGEALTALSRIISITQSIPTSMLWVETITMRNECARFIEAMDRASTAPGSDAVAR